MQSHWTGRAGSCSAGRKLRTAGNGIHWLADVRSLLTVEWRITCRREVLEEVNTEIETPVCIGYQQVDEENGTPAYAQVRMAALIREIGIKKPDPDNGRIYDRLMVSAEKAAELLNWGDVGTAQVMKARDTICQKYGIRYTGKPDEWV